MKKTSKVAKSRASSPKKTARKRTKESVLATCPVGNAGWCPYPFSVSQLEKRLKKMAEDAKQEAILAR